MTVFPAPCADQERKRKEKNSRVPTRKIGGGGGEAATDRYRPTLSSSLSSTTSDDFLHSAARSSLSLSLPLSCLSLFLSFFKASVIEGARETATRFVSDTKTQVERQRREKERSKRSRQMNRAECVMETLERTNERTKRHKDNIDNKKKEKEK